MRRRLIYATAEPDAVRAAQARLGVAQAGRMVEDALADLAVAARERPAGGALWWPVAKPPAR
jgi:uncharacterized protein YgbK (DUF1537 family)